MKFYNREKELSLLQKIEERSKRTAQMTFVVGQRRIGKTSLLVKSNQGKSMLYFFVAKKMRPCFVKNLCKKSGISYKWKYSEN